MISGRITPEAVAAARQQLRESRAAKFSPEVQVALQALWTAARRAPATRKLSAVRDAAQQLKTAHFAAGWTEAESMSEAIELLQACLDGGWPEVPGAQLSRNDGFALLHAIADGFGVDLDDDAPRRLLTR